MGHEFQVIECNKIEGFIDNFCIEQQKWELYLIGAF